MKLIVTIPCYNEEANLADVIAEIPRQLPGVSSVQVMVVDDGSSDRTVEIAREAGADFVIEQKANKGLARTFQLAQWEAIVAGADIIVNTDGDNHYDQSRIGELITPIVEGKADIVIGSRKNLNTKNKHWNKLGSFVMTKWAGIPKYDVSTGFRAYTREASMKLQVYSTHTYSHTTILSALDLGLVMVELPIPDRIVERPSRLISSVPSHIWKAGWNIVRNIVIFRPLRFFGIIGALLFAAGLIPVVRFLFLWMTGQGSGHIQSLILAAVLILLGYINLVLGLLGSSIGWHRKITEEVLYRLKQLEADHNRQQ